MNSPAWFGSPLQPWGPVLLPGDREANPQPHPLLHTVPSPSRKGGDQRPRRPRSPQSSISPASVTAPRPASGPRHWPQPERGPEGGKAHAAYKGTPKTISVFPNGNFRPEESETIMFKILKERKKPLGKNSATGKVILLTKATEIPLSRRPSGFDWDPPSETRSREVWWPSHCEPLCYGVPCLCRGAVVAGGGERTGLLCTVFCNFL